MLKVRFYGVRGSIPSPSTRGWKSFKYGGNTSCLSLVEEKDYSLILDAGSGMRILGNRLFGLDGDGRMGRKNPFNSGDSFTEIFMSHLHWDHIIGLPFYLPIYVPGNRVVIYGCPGTEKALRSVFKKPVFPVNFEDIPATVEVIEIPEGKPLTRAKHRFLPAYLNHPDPTYGYRITRCGKVFVYATDTEHGEEWDKPMRRLAKNADVLVYDTQFTHQEYDPAACEKKGITRRNWGHSIAQEGVRLCARAGVKMLVPFHYDPSSPDGKIDDVMRFIRKFARVEAPVLKIKPAFEGMTLNL